MYKLQVEGLSKKINGTVILEDINFQLKEGEFLSIIGPSGCGKTSLLRALIGIDQINAGKIMVDGKDVTDAHPSKRKMGMIFQNYALFPNLTVLENVMIALNGNYTKKEKRIMSEKILEKVGLSDHIFKKPKELSGGQQQRAAIARVLVQCPEIILFDEPLSALDASIRLKLRKEIKKLQKELNITMIYVTHDQEDAFCMSDRIIVMNHGVIEQDDTPANVYNHPKNEYVYRFVKEHIDEAFSRLKANIIN